ncbi:MAG: NUDIX domain-containing protein [Alphaproteobacteria bacterium]
MPEDHPDVRILERTRAFQGYFAVGRYRLRYRRHDGQWSPELTREVFERGHAVAVLPYDPVRDAVVLIEQFRIGAHVAGRAAWLIEVVAGIAGPGEDNDSVARRETLEETGLAVSDLVAGPDYLVSPGGSSESVALFCGRVDSSQALPFAGQADEGEDIRVFVEPANQAIARLHAGTLSNAFTIIALGWFEREREQLRRIWS